MPLATASSSAASSSASPSPASGAGGSSSKPGAGDRGRLKQLGGRRRQPGEAPAGDLADALGAGELLGRADDAQRAAVDLDRAGLGERPPQLADQEGVAAGQLAHRGRQARQLGAGLAAGGAAGQLADLGRGEALKPQPHDVLGAAQVGERLGQRARHLGLGVAEGRDQQQPRLGGRARQVAQQQQRRGVGPVDILEQQQQRPLPAGLGQQRGDRRVQAVALGVGVGVGLAPH